MKPPRPPRFETRRARELEAELVARARAWIAAWGMDDAQRDFGRALLKIAARFGSEVAERLDRAGEKNRLGLLDWLAVRGQAARAARLPVVFKLAEQAREARLAQATTRLQVEAAGVSLILETETDALLLPGRLQTLIGVDGAADGFYMAPPGLSSLKPLAPQASQWQLKNFAAAGATQLQLEPEQGLVPGLLLALGDRQYRVVLVDNDIVTLAPPLEQDHAARAGVTRVSAFMPFDGAAANRQEHALYLGHDELFNLAAPATIEITGARELGAMAWHYWGKRRAADAPGWQALRVAPARSQAGADGVVLDKPRGSIDMLELAPGSTSRWIRASLASLAPDRAPLRVDSFGVRINCRPAADPLPDADPAVNADSASNGPSAQGMANTTPLVLSDEFSPLGREPRQFDAFYLGSQEAFSKKGAQVELDFVMADPNFASLTSLRSGPLAHLRVAGVAANGELHLLQFFPESGALSRLPDHLPLRPPTPAGQGASTALGNRRLALDPHPAYRVPLWATATGFAVAVAAQGAVWVWDEQQGAPQRSGWKPLDVVDPAADPGTRIEALVYLADGPFGRLIALRDARLYLRDPELPSARWEQLETKTGGHTLTWARIAPIGSESGDPGNGTLAGGLIGVSLDHRLFFITLSGTPLQGVCTELRANIASMVTPLAVRRNDSSLLAVAVDRRLPPHLLAISAHPDTPALDAEADVLLGAQPVLGGLLDIKLDDDALTVLLALGGAAGATALASWVPFAAPGLNTLFKVSIPASVGAAGGAPTFLPQHVLVPTATSQVMSAGFDLRRRVALLESLRSAVITAAAADRLAVGDQLAIPVDAGSGGRRHELREITASGMAFGGKLLHEFNLEARDAPLLVYRRTAPRLVGTVDPEAPDTLEIAASDAAPADGDVLLIITNRSTQLYVVRGFDPGTRIARLDRHLDLASPAPPTLSYVAPRTSAASVLPMLHLNPASTAAWPASLLDRVRLYFPGADPEFQAATAYQAAGTAPELVVLQHRWRRKPSEVAGKVQLIVDGALDGWTVQLGDSTTQPELSWEYWNGKGWWKLKVNDRTFSLKQSGSVSFPVPTDIASSDWAGQTNYWIRARLIGGDYGRESVTVLTQDLGEGKSEQTVQRSTEGIRAPLVAHLRIAYSVCAKVQPSSVLVRDSGSLRDQSEANRSPGAQVEAFVPLALLLGRLSGSPGGPAARCAGSIASGAAAPASSAASASPPALGRAIYLGFDAPLLGEPVNLLLLVEERPHDQYAPMRVEALIADRFVPVAADDATRALGESGVLSLAFPVAPTARELFGETLCWLRLSPAAGAGAEQWQPKLLGAYLNGVWACAAETLTRELVGSSQGEPNLRLFLARPPLLRDTLELRVKEPLGEEELAALVAERADAVLSALENLPGNWVLWTQVIDPGDEAPTARVYALDEASGEIRFGDGRHGKIPPIGRDAILALSYRRSAPAAPGSLVVPGNAIGARTALNLVSPIAGVEQVLAADQAAGGAPAEDVDLVLRFGSARLRHRQRALTARDLEDLALQSSADIAQARCFPRASFVQLVLVMRGADPTPAAAQRRALHRTLVDAAPPWLGAPEALRIGAPTLRLLRIDLRLRVLKLADAGAVALAARDGIGALFDPASGGVDGAGWPLGRNPGEADIAIALAQVARLHGIAALSLLEIAEDGAEQPWPDSLAPGELAWLAKDGVRIAFESVEVQA